MSSEDAEERGIADDDLIRLWNRRGSVVCAAQVTERLRPGVVSAYSGSAQVPTGRGRARQVNRSRWLREHVEHQEVDHQ